MVAFENRKFVSRFVSMFALSISAGLMGCSSDIIRVDEPLLTSALGKKSVHSSPQVAYNAAGRVNSGYSTEYTGSVSSLPSASTQPAVSYQPQVSAAAAPSQQVQKNSFRLPQISMPKLPSLQRSTSTQKQEPIQTAYGMYVPSNTVRVVKPAPQSTEDNTRQPLAATSSGQSMSDHLGRDSSWSAEQGTVVRIVSGETLDMVARKYGVPKSALQSANNLPANAVLAPGQSLVIPRLVFRSSDAGSSSQNVSRVMQSVSTQGESAALSQHSVPQPVPHSGSAPARSGFLSSIFRSTPSSESSDQITTASVAPSPQIPVAAGLPPKRPILSGVSAPVSQISAPLPRKPAVAQVYAARESIPSTSSSPSGLYRVQSGDSLRTVASRFGLSEHSLVSANGLKSGSVLRTGQTLTIPGVSAQRIAVLQRSYLASLKNHDDDRLSTAAIPHDASSSAKAAVPNRTLSSVGVQSTSHSAATASVNPPASVKLRWPVRGHVISRFGQSYDGSVNQGINIAVPEGAPIKSAEDGVVTYVGNEVKGYGNLILVQHDNGMITAYAHARDVFVQRNQRITRGQTIASVGRSGSVQRPQLHFQVRQGSTPLNPEKFL